MFFQLEFDKFATIFRLFLLLELEKSELLATINFRILQKTCNHLFFLLRVTTFFLFVSLVMLTCGAVFYTLVWVSA